MTFGKNIISGFGWLSLLKVFMKGLTLIKIVIIARILSPKDLGLFGLTTVVLSLIEVMTETGINTFLIQKKDGISKYVHTAWCISIVRGIGISVLVFLSSFFLARFYNDAQLLPLLFAVAFIPLIKGFINPSIITYHKEMKYSLFALFRSCVFFVETASAILLALILKNPIALLYAMIISSAFEVMISFVFVRPLPKLMFSKVKALEILHFGKWLNMSGLFSFLGNNMDDLITGKILGTTKLGFYQTAFNITQSTVGEVGDLSAQTLFPIYSLLNKDKKQMKHVLIRVLIPLMVILFIPVALLTFFPSELVGIILGEKWLPLLPILPWLLASAYFQALNGATYPIFLAVYKPYFSTITVFVNLVVMLVTIFPLSHQFGLVGVGMSVFISKLCVQPLYVYFAWKTLWKNEK